MERREKGLSDLDVWVRKSPWAGDALMAAALAMVLGPTSFTLLSGADWTPAARSAVIALVALGHLSVAARRVRPVAAYVMCCLVMLTLVFSPDLAEGGAADLAGQVVPPILLPSALVFPVVLYAVAAYAAKPWPLIALVVGLVGAGLTAVRLWLAGEWLGAAPGAAISPAAGGVGWRLFVLVALVAAVLAPWGLGRFRGVRAAYVGALEERALRAEQDRAERARQAVAAERARIAREMHDVVAHSLAVIVRQAEGGRCAAGKDPPVAVQALIAVAATGREALADMRTVLGLLHRADGPVDSGPQPAVDDVPALVEHVRTTGMSVTLTTTGSATVLHRAATLAAYRVVQEALTNVVKHAGRGAVVAVRLDWQDTGLDIAVTDDGGLGGAGRVDVPTGVDASADKRVGYGLMGMAERVQLVGGHLVAGPLRDPGEHGFAVRVHLPVASSAPPT